MLPCFRQTTPGVEEALNVGRSINPISEPMEIKMSYYTSLINRKFRDVVGKRYDAVLREYSEFLLTEEEMQVAEVSSILIPLDIFVEDVPPELYEVLSAYDADVTLAYIIDAHVYNIIKETLNESSADELRVKREEYGHSLLSKISDKLEEAGVDSQQRLFLGNKGEDVEKMVGNYDLIALSKSYGAEHGETKDISPLVIRLTQKMTIPTLIY